MVILRHRHILLEEIEHNTIVQPVHIRKTKYTHTPTGKNKHFVDGKTDSDHTSSYTACKQPQLASCDNGFTKKAQPTTMRCLL